jgi:formate hydrogenlyase transcriptional activator
MLDRLLARLCQDLRRSLDCENAFDHTAEAIQQLTRCARVQLIAPECSLVKEFEATPRSEQTGPNEERIAVSVPLGDIDNSQGSLTITAKRETDVALWDSDALRGIAALLAMALDHLVTRARVRELERFQRESAFLRDEIKAERDLRLLTGESAAMKSVRTAVQQVARTDSTVLIQGETGTGKELVARAIHQLSPRHKRLLVAVNCAALAPGIINSELFGHEAGAFTGATKRRVGRFELAQGGTLFLDEIGELPAETQVLLLRVLQTRIIERVGGADPIPVDVRIIAATHRDLTALVKSGRLRADLFYRLNVFPISVPPLRERREDIADLVRHFVLHFSRRMGRPAPRVNDGAMRLLRDYSWPGNVRELENLIERAMIVTTAETLALDPSWLRTSDALEAASSARLADQERHAIVEALARCGGRVYGPRGAAALLGVKPTTLYGKMRKHRIARPTPGRSDQGFTSSDDSSSL